MEDASPELKKAQVKELEQIARELEEQNKQLLNKVSTSNSSKQAIYEDEDGALTTEDDLEEALLDLEEVNPNLHSEGEWLYVSPKLPLTPVQKKQTPLQWLSEGHNQRLGDVDIPSLDEVRKALVFNMEEAETISKAAHPKPTSVNSTAQKYLNRVRERSRSNSPVGNGNVLNYTRNDEPIQEDTVPVVKWKARMPQEESEEVPVVRWQGKMPNKDVPVVKWKAKVPQEMNEVLEDVPIVKWKAKVPPELNEDIPVVKWKAKMPQEETEDVPVVKWKAKMPQEKSEDVPVVKWKAKMPQEETEDVPVVKWKAKMPQEKSEDVPVVKWKAKMPQEETEDVPVVKWKAKMPQEGTEDVPVVKWKAKMPNDNANTQTRPSGSPGQSKISPRNSGLVRPVKRIEAVTSSNAEEMKIADTGLKRNRDNEQRSLKGPGKRQPQGGVSPSQSPTSLPVGAGRGLRIPRTVSPGRSLHTRSPSPPTTGRKQLSRPTAAASHHNSSPGKSNLVQPSGSPKTAKRQLQGPSPPTSKHLSGLPAAPKSVQDGGQRMSRLQASTPPQSGGIRTPGSTGLHRPSPQTSGKRGLTPPNRGGAKPRRTLPTPPSSGSATKRQQQSVIADDDSWLEGCF